MIQVYFLSRLGAIALAAPFFQVKKDPIGLFLFLSFFFGYGFIRFWIFWVPKCCGVIITLDSDKGSVG